MKTAEAIQRDVLDELAWDPQVNSADIAVTMHDGVVRLAGSVSSFTEKLAAEKATRRVAGVQAIVDDLEVKLVPGSMLADEQLAKHASESLQRSFSVPKHKVTVTVDNGWVKLTGEVPWGFQRKAAENAVRYLYGVKGVTNLVSVVQKVDRREIKDRIELALKRSAQIDAGHVTVTVVDGKVTLTGTVHTWAARREAENAAWSAAGVTDVVNKLVIEIPVTSGW
jgi:osmotically-inducible protein OsmY